MRVFSGLFLCFFISVVSATYSHACNQEKIVEFLKTNANGKDQSVIFDDFFTFAYSNRKYFNECHFEYIQQEHLRPPFIVFPKFTFRYFVHMNDGRLCIERGDYFDPEKALTEAQRKYAAERNERLNKRACKQI